jgi:hypothetical protein
MQISRQKTHTFVVSYLQRMDLTVFEPWIFLDPHSKSPMTVLATKTCHHHWISLDFDEGVNQRSYAWKKFPLYALYQDGVL